MESIRVLFCAMPQDVERVLRIITDLLDVIAGKACIEDGGSRVKISSRRGFMNSISCLTLTSFAMLLA